jgi:hypothetical protein
MANPYGWFTFPAAPQGVYTFVFHDDDNQIQTPPITLSQSTGKTLPTGKLGLAPYRIPPLEVVGYIESYTDDGRLLLTTANGPAACSIEERPHGPPDGKRDYFGVINYESGKYRFDIYDSSQILIRRVGNLPITADDGYHFAYTRGCEGFLLQLLRTLEPVEQ